MELLLRRVYGGAIEVPVSLALQLYALADQYQLAAGLQQQLRLWVMALQLAPEALCAILPAARTLCPEAFSCISKHQAAKALDQLSPLPAFAAWPVDAVVEVMKWAAPLPAFNAAVAWMGAQLRPGKQGHVWQRLLDAVPWAKASSSDLNAALQHASAPSVPGLQQRVAEAALRLCKVFEEEESKVKAENLDLRKQMQELQQQAEQWQEQEQQQQEELQRQQEQQQQQEQQHQADQWQQRELQLQPIPWQRQEQQQHQPIQWQQQWELQHAADENPALAAIRAFQQFLPQEEEEWDQELGQPRAVRQRRQ